jgi:hypothetical protein
MAKRAAFAGEGELTFNRRTEVIAFQFEADDKLQQGKGSIVGESDYLRAAFREGVAQLTLDDGRKVPIFVVAHTDGGDTAYFELRGLRR